MMTQRIFDTLGVNGFCHSDLCSLPFNFSYLAALHMKPDAKFRLGRWHGVFAYLL